MKITRRHTLGLVAAALMTTVGPLPAQEMKSNGFSKLKAKLDDGRSARLMIWGDSTGNCRNNKGRWPIRLAHRLAETYPGHAVHLKNWNTKTLASFDTPVIVSKGSGFGAPVLEILNMSVSGSVPQLMMGELWPLTIGSAEPDALIINHGINLVLGWNPKSQHGTLWLGAMLTAIWQFWSRWPDCPISCVLQSPQRDTARYDALVHYWNTVSGITGIPLIDIFSIYQKAGKPSDWYVDNTHPSEPKGNTIWADAIWSHYRASLPLQGSFRNDFNRAAPTAQLLDNPDFSLWADTSNAPDGWDTIGSVRFARDTHMTAGVERPFSLLMTAPGGKPAGIRQFLTPEKLKLCAGRRVFFVARCNKGHQTSVTSLGSIEVVIRSPSTGDSYLGNKYYNNKQGAFAWWGIGPIVVPDDVEQLEVRLYHDHSNAPSGQFPVWFDQASLVIGSRPGLPGET